MPKLISILLLVSTFNVFATYDDNVLTITRTYDFKAVDHQLPSNFYMFASSYKCPPAGNYTETKNNLCIEFKASSYLGNDKISISNNDRALFNNIKKQYSDPKQRIIAENRLNQFLIDSYNAIENDMIKLKARFN